MTKPIHSSQQIVTQNEDGSMVMVIQVIPNKELIQQLLSFGKDLKVTAPATMVQKLREEFAVVINNYQP